MSGTCVGGSALDDYGHGTHVACISNNGHDDTGAVTCAVGRNARCVFPLLVSRAGHTLYNVDGSDGGFSTFHINGNGTLTQRAGTRGCTTVDGKDSNGASTCAIARVVDSPYSGAISPDGLSLYISNDDDKSGGGLSVFAINRSSGVAIQQAGLNGCITNDGSSNGVAAACVNGRALGDGYGMSISPDGHSIYQATDASNNAGLAIYSRTQLTLSGLKISPHEDPLQTERRRHGDLHSQEERPQAPGQDHEGRQSR